MAERCHAQREHSILLTQQARNKGLKDAAKAGKAEEKRKSATLREIQRAANREQNAKNMSLSKRRKQARKIKNELIANWEREYGHLFLRASAASKRRHRQKRERLERLTKDPKVLAIEQTIRRGPCSCYWCGLRLPKGGQVDHVVPLSKGGAHGFGNLVPSCSTCNQKKRDKLPSDFRVSIQPELVLIHANEQKGDTEKVLFPPQGSVHCSFNREPEAVEGAA